MDMGRSDRPAGGRAVVLPIGSEAALGQQTIAFMHAAASTHGGRFLASRAATTPATPRFDKKIVLIGSLTEDRYTEHLRRART